MSDEEFCSEDEDDWFYDSIKRYKHLLMFDFENTPMQLGFSDTESVCVASMDGVGCSDLLELALPKKLTVAPEQEGLVKSCDFKMKCGGFTQATLVQMRVLHGRKRILTSEQGEPGVAVYQLGSEKADVITRVGGVPCELVAPRLSHNKDELLALATLDDQDLVVVDTAQGRIRERIKWTEGDSQGHSIEPTFVSPHVVSLCRTNTGHVTVFDVRGKRGTCNFSPGQQGACNGEWTSFSSYLSSPLLEDTGDQTKFGLLSAAGRVCIYDLRNIEEPVCEGQCMRGSETFQLPAIQFCPTNSSIVSISGYNDCVNVYDVASAEPKTIFIHDGHSKQHSLDKNHLVTCHVWFDNIVISASKNKSVHCWQFI